MRKPRNRQVSGLSQYRCGNGACLHREWPGRDNLVLHAVLNLCREGNVIVGDADGVICIPRKDAPAVLEAAKKFRANDKKKEAASKDGSADCSWVERTPEAKGFEIIDDVYRP